MTTVFPRGPVCKWGIGSKFRVPTSSRPESIYTITKVIDQHVFVECDEVRLIFWSNEVDNNFFWGIFVPVTEPTAPTPAESLAPECDECYGTGYYKGFGMVCSRGCNAP